MNNVQYVLHKIEIAQAFDELSILEIKKAESTDQKQRKLLGKQIRILGEEIDQSIDSDLAVKIYCSDLYTNLYNTNFDIFKSVDKFKTFEPVQLNLKRFEAKRKLQEFFSGGDLAEIKI